MKSSLCVFGVALLAHGVLLADAGALCTSPTQCQFHGLTHTALGAAQLSLDTSEHLVVSNIGSSGDDGVEVDLAVRIEAWEDDFEITNAAGLPAGAFLRTDVSYGGAVGWGHTWTVEPEGGGGPYSVQLLPSGSPGLSGSYTVEIYNGGLLVSRETGVTGWVARAGVWPTRFFIPEVEDEVLVAFAWPSGPVELTGGGSIGVRMGDELRIIAEGVLSTDTPVTGIAIRAAGMPSFTVVTEAFVEAVAIPSLLHWRLVGFSVLLALLGGYHLRRRTRALT